LQPVRQRRIVRDKSSIGLRACALQSSGVAQPQPIGLDEVAHAMIRDRPEDKKDDITDLQQFMDANVSVPLQRRESRRDPWQAWAVFFVTIVVLVNRPWQTTTLPPASALGATDFSADRAWAHVEMLATTLGRRVSGTATAARAADYIEGRLRELGVETVRQVASGRVETDHTTYVYRGIQNVLARVPGKRPAAILVSAHYDSAVDGPGAGDNALNVAAALETVRAMTESDVPTNTVIFSFTDGEEMGLLGAGAFLEHPWRGDVAAFINLDASGPAGRQLLLQATPGRDDLLDAYAAGARYMHGTVLAQEIFQVLPLDTDYHVYHDAGLGGIDLAPYGDAYAYHTPLDRTDRISRRTLQESGENVLAIVRGAPALSIGSRNVTAATPATYYDLLGLTMVRYSSVTARISGLVIAAVALVLVGTLAARTDSLAANTRGIVRGRVRPPFLPARPVSLGAAPDSHHGMRRLPAMAALGTAAVGGTALLSMLVPVLGSVLVTATGHAMFWYARPWIAFCVYGTLALAGTVIGPGGLRLLARRRTWPADAAADAWRRGLVVCWALLLLLTTVLRLGSAYLPLWWCVGTTLAFVASIHLHGVRRWLVTLAAMTLAAITTIQAAELLWTSLVPLTSMLGATASADALVAGLTALAVAPFALLVIPAIPPARSLRRVAAWWVGAAVVMVLLVVYSFPYTPERPKRAYLDVRVGAENRAHVIVETIDPGPDFAIKDVALDTVVTRAAPTIDALPAALAEPSQPRTVEIHVNAAGAYKVDVTIDGGTISWPGASRVSHGTHLVWIGTGEPLTFYVASASAAPVGVHAQAFYLGTDVSIDDVVAQLPRWSTLTVQTVLETSGRF
jgi:hypothetical protein